MAAMSEWPRQDLLRSRLVELGFDEVRFARVPTEPLRCREPQREIGAWLQSGMQADMHWMERSLDKRRDPRLVVPGARSIILLGVSYRRDAGAPASGHPVWARYALHDDYHDTMKPGLVAAGRLLEELYGVGSTDYRYYVDTGPVIERGWAAEAGVGFVGKNAMLISREHGNWLFLAAIATTLELVPDEPLRKTTTAPRGAEVDGAASVEAGPSPSAREVSPVGLFCGKCTRCLDACPTAAFAAPGVVDARRCVSYQTIENKGVIPRELRRGIGNRIYGCDVCLEVCPWNRFARAGRGLLLHVRGEIAECTLADLLDLTPERFAALFRGTPIKRVKLAGLLRNACVVAGNSGDPSLLPRLVRLATSHPLPLVRAHAVWAVRQLGGADQLETARATETDPTVRAEYT